MYFYIYDTFLADRRHERELAVIEACLMDLGLSGKISRLTPFNNARGLIRDEARRGLQTLVAVGDDETIAKVIDGLGDVPTVTLGIIPIGNSCTIADSLGIPSGEEACEVLSRRVAQCVDLGSANGHPFLSEVRVFGPGIVVETDGSFRLTSLAPDAEIVVSNLRTREMAEGLGPTWAGDPMDGKLDLMVVRRGASGMLGFRKQDQEVTVIQTHRATITAPEPFEVWADGREFSTDSLVVETVPDRLKVVTGRERVFGEPDGGIAPDVPAA